MIHRTNIMEDEYVLHKFSKCDSVLYKIFDNLKISSFMY